MFKHVTTFSMVIAFLSSGIAACGEKAGMSGSAARKGAERRKMPASVSGSDGDDGSDGKDGDHDESDDRVSGVPDGGSSSDASDDPRGNAGRGASSTGIGGAGKTGLDGGGSTGDSNLEVKDDDGVIAGAGSTEIETGAGSTEIETVDGSSAVPTVPAPTTPAAATCSASNAASRVGASEYPANGVMIDNGGLVSTGFHTFPAAPQLKDAYRTGHGLAFAASGGDFLTSNTATVGGSSGPSSGSEVFVIQSGAGQTATLQINFVCPQSGQGGTVPGASLSLWASDTNPTPQPRVILRTHSKNGAIIEERTLASEGALISFSTGDVAWLEIVDNGGDGSTFDDLSFGPIKL